METKFTSDGKKVAVVGKLNAQETIVQEIFCTEAGAEIPSGENFVVKSLHDSPVISWKEKNLKEIEERYERTQKQYSDLITKQEKDYREKRDLLKDKYQFVAAALKNISPESFDLLGLFLQDKIKYVVVQGYEWKVLNFDSKLKNQPDSWGNQSHIKLLSFFGTDDGKLETRINNYSDGSGSWETIIPFETYRDAVEHLKTNWLDVGDLNIYKIQAAEKHGVTLSEESVKVYTQAILKSKEEQLASVQKTIEGLNLEINQIAEGIFKLPNK